MTHVRTFGILSDGTTANLYTVRNGRMSFSLTDYGATITSIVLHGSAGVDTDVALGYATLADYEADNASFGATVARFANRISGGRFLLDGTCFLLDQNDGAHTLHSGFTRSNKLRWTVVPFELPSSTGVHCTRRFLDGEQGFPGTLDVTVTVALDSEQCLMYRAAAVTDARTPVSITNHTYFNLAGTGSVRDHLLTVYCPAVLAIDGDRIPTGALLPVSGTAFDFLREKRIGKDIALLGAGYDHCYVTAAYQAHTARSGIPHDDTPLVRVARLREPKSGRSLIIETNTEGMQLYTGNELSGILGKQGYPYQNHDGICFETEAFPDSPNRPEFPSCILNPGERLCATTVYRFAF
ncbi:MAG: galactose mutarotase [Treponema sp.]|nr:galactose mutarotase [Treponema sp.]